VPSSPATHRVNWIGRSRQDPCALDFLVTHEWEKIIGTDSRPSLEGNEKLLRNMRCTGAVPPPSGLVAGTWEAGHVSVGGSDEGRKEELHG